MALKRFGNLAIEWDRLYAAQVLAKDFHEVLVVKLSLFADMPESTPGEPIATMENADAQTVWHHIMNDARFARFGQERPFALDMTKVLMVKRQPESQQSLVTLQLADERSVTLKAGRDLATRILEAIPPSPVAG